MVDSKEAVDVMLDVIQVCKEKGACYGEMFMYRDHRDTFLAMYAPRKYLSVTRIQNEDIGQALLLVHFEDGGIQVLTYTPGFWTKYIEEAKDLYN